MIILSGSFLAHPVADALVRSRPDASLLPEAFDNGVGHRFDGAGLPTDADGYRRWAKTRMSTMGVASAISLDREAGRLSRTVRGPYPVLERAAALRRRMSGRAVRGKDEAIRSAPSLHRADLYDGGLADALDSKPGPVVLLYPDDVMLEKVADVLTFQTSLKGQQLIWLEEQAMSRQAAVRQACWAEALRAFGDLALLEADREPQALAARILETIDQSAGAGGPV